MTKPSDNTIKNVLENKGTQQDAKIVAKWFSTPKGQVYLKTLMDKEYYQNINDDIDFNQKETLQNIDKAIKIKKKRLVFAKIAIVLIPFLLLVSTLWYMNTNKLPNTIEMQTVSTGKGEKLEIKLYDGTQIYINPETTITFPLKNKSQTRRVTLNGEAYFNVVKKVDQPFIILSGKSIVRVLGTSFLMTSYDSDETLKVILDKGNIAFSNKNEVGKELKAGEKLKYNKNTGSITVSKKHEQRSYNKGKDRFISFEDDSLKTVIQTLNRWYDVSFIVNNDAAYHYSFTTSFNNNSLDEIIAELQKLSPLVFITTKDNIVIDIDY